jgi:hypothetical protein
MYNMQLYTPPSGNAMCSEKKEKKRNAHARCDRVMDAE